MGDAFKHPLKRGNFTLEVLSSCVRQLVDTNPTVGRGHTPLRLNPSLFEHSLESGIQRSFFNLEQLIGRFLDVPDQGIAMHGRAFERLEDHHLQGAGKKVAAFGGFHSISFVQTRVC